MIFLFLLIILWWVVNDYLDIFKPFSVFLLSGFNLNILGFLGVNQHNHNINHGKCFVLRRIEILLTNEIKIELNSVYDNSCHYIDRERKRTSSNFNLPLTLLNLGLHGMNFINRLTLPEGVTYANSIHATMLILSLNYHLDINGFSAFLILANVLHARERESDHIS